MGNESESTQKKKEKSENNEIKKEKSENNEINEELKKNLDLFYRAVNCDPNSIEKICPVCFKSNAYDDIPKIASNKVDTDKEKEDFKKDYIRQIKANKIIIDEESVLKFDLERCNHFTCYSCSGGRFDLPCYFCQNFLTPRNIICFGKLDEVEEDFKKIICQFHGKFILKKNQPKECKKQLLDNAKHFLLWHNDIIEAAYKKRMKEIEQMRKDFPKKYKSNYGITDEMIEQYKEEKKIKLKEKKEEEERRAHMLSSIHNNDDNDNDNDDDNSSSNREMAYGLYACGGKNCKLCFKCGNSHFCDYVKLYAHKSCFPYDKCYACRSKKHYGHERVNMCSDCLKKLIKQKGNKYSEYCYVCGEKILFKSMVSFMK